MSKGTIIYMGGFELPDKNAAAIRVLCNGKILKQAGYNVVFIGIDKNLAYDNYVLKMKVGIQGFDSWSIPYPSSNRQWIDYMCSIKSFLTIVKEYPDLKAVICYDFQAPALIKIKKYCNKKKIKIISDCAEWYGRNEGTIIFKFLKWVDTTLRMMVINKRVDGLIVVSKFLNAYYAKKKTIVIPTLVDGGERCELNLCDHEQKVLVYAGVPFRKGKQLKNRELAKDRLDEAIFLLYQLYKRGVKFRFNIFGLTKEDYLIVLPNDKDMIDEMKDSIVFHGFVDNTEIKRNIQLADFSILLRDKNRMTMAGFPTKFTESIINGTPVITTRTSDLEDYLIEGKNGFFIDVNDKSTAIDKLERILKLDNDKVKELKKYCSEYTELNLENWTNLVEDFLEEIGAK